jgi:hypothetical protein
MTDIATLVQSECSEHATKDYYHTSQALQTLTSYYEMDFILSSPSEQVSQAVYHTANFNLHFSCLFRGSRALKMPHPKLLQCEVGNTSLRPTYNSPKPPSPTFQLLICSKTKRKGSPFAKGHDTRLGAPRAEINAMSRR